MGPCLLHHLTPVLSDEPCNPGTEVTAIGEEGELLPKVVSDMVLSPGAQWEEKGCREEEEEAAIYHSVSQLWVM